MFMKKAYLIILIFATGQLFAQTSRSSSSSQTKERERVVVNSDAKIQSFDENNGIVELTEFPVYKNTGNKKMDDANHLMAKKSWIQENQEGAISMRVFKDENWDYENMAGFPKYTNTGNETNDKIVFNEAVKKWFQDNPQIYKQLKSGKN
jgi:hypothetical protein